VLSWLANAWRVPELRRRLLFTAVVLALYRLGSFIPAPGVNSATISNYFSGRGGTVLVRTPDDAAVHRELGERGIICDFRPDAGIRLGPHFYNTEDELRHTVAQLVEIVELVRQRSVAVVWVEHVVHALTSAVSRIICLSGGRLIAEGDPKDVLANPEVKEVYLGADVGA